MKTDKCPECGEKMESGFINAQNADILWLKEEKTKWRCIFSSKVEKLQNDWWVGPKFSKDNLPAL